MNVFVVAILFALFLTGYYLFKKLKKAPAVTEPKAPVATEPKAPVATEPEVKVSSDES